MRRLAAALLLVIPFMLAPGSGSAQPASWYVAAGAGAGDGSRERPFNSLQQAEAASAPGDTILLLAAAGVLDGGISLQPGQKLLGVDRSGAVLTEAGGRIRLTNSGERQAGVIVQLADHNEVAGLHFQNMRGYAISGAGRNYSGTHIHHNTFTGNAAQHIEDERGLVYAVSLDADAGVQRDILIEDSAFYDGEDLGAIRVFHSGDSYGNYLFRRNDFSDLGGRPYFVRTRERSRVETVILDSTADNIGRGERNSDSIIPYLMGQSEQVMLVRNYHFKNSKQEGNASNTAIEAFMFGFPREDVANFCTACKLDFRIYDSVIEDAVTDAIQFSNSGRNSQLHFEIRNTRIIGGNPRQGGGGISLNLQSVADSGSRTTLLVEDTAVIGTTGYGFAMNNRGGGDGHSVLVDLGGGALGSRGNNLFIDNARGDLRVSGERVSARNNRWDGDRPAIFGPDNEPIDAVNVLIDRNKPE